LDFFKLLYLDFSIIPFLIFTFLTNSVVVTQLRKLLFKCPIITWIILISLFDSIYFYSLSPKKMKIIINQKKKQIVALCCPVPRDLARPITPESTDHNSAPKRRFTCWALPRSVALTEGILVSFLIRTSLKISGLLSKQVRLIHNSNVFGFPSLPLYCHTASHLAKRSYQDTVSWNNFAFNLYSRISPRVIPLTWLKTRGSEFRNITLKKGHPSFTTPLPRSKLNSEAILSTLRVSRGHSASSS
jgi:hypothetical protein